MRVSDLTERELVSRIERHLAPAPSWMVVGVGDDAAVVEPVRNQLDVLTVDAVVEGVHFDRAFSSPAAIGHRALAVNLSDLAAMGAAPRMALLSLVLPAMLSCDDFDAMIEGLAALARAHSIHVAGGNLTTSPGPLMLDVTAVGSVKRRGILTRKGARPGDDIYVTGVVGAARAGLQCLQAKRANPSLELAIERYLFPQPRVRTGMMLGRNRAASACMDLSDGLADGLRQITEASGVGATIDAGAIPLDPGARAWFASQGLDPLTEALAGGDDYELVFTASPRIRRRLREVDRHGGVPLIRIGACTPEPGVRLSGMFDGRAVDAPLPQGFSHFRCSI